MTDAERLASLQQIITDLGESVQNVTWHGKPADPYVACLCRDASAALMFLCALRDRWAAVTLAR